MSCFLAKGQKWHLNGAYTGMISKGKEIISTILNKLSSVSPVA
jgi:hypothetical protein